MSITIERMVSRDGLVKPESLSGYTFTGEADAHTFIIATSRRGATEALTGTVTGSFLRADNEVVDLTGSVVSGKAELTLTGECYNVPGRFLLTVYVTNSSETEAIYSATGNVQRADSDTHVDTGIIPNFASLSAAQEAANEAAAAANAAAAECEDVVDEVLEAMPKALDTTWTQQTIGKDGTEWVITSNSTRCLSGLLTVTEGDTYTSTNGVKFRLGFEKNGEAKGLQGSFTDSYTITSDNASKYDKCYICARQGDGTADIIPATAAANVHATGSNAVIIDVASVDDLDALDTRVTAVEDELDAKRPWTYVLQNKASAISSQTETLTDSDKYLLSAVIQVASGQTISVPEGWVVRGSFRGSQNTIVNAWNNWTNNWSCTGSNSAGYYRFQFKKSDESAIAPEDIKRVITATVALPVTYNAYASDDEMVLIRDRLSAATNQYNLNICVDGCENVMQSYPNSFWPQAVSFTRTKDKLYYGFCSGDGYSGVGEYDFDTRAFRKALLKKADPDDHNMPAVFVTGNGTVIGVYSEGHNAGRNLYVRRSSVPESVESFDDAIAIPCGGDTTYAQILQYDGKLYLFFRRNNQEWWYTTSADEGLTWSAVKGVIRQPADYVQYYCKFQYTETPGVFRMCMYANPTAPRYNDILTGFVDFTGDAMVLRKGDNSTVVAQVDDEYGGAKYAEDTSTYNFTKIIDQINHDYDEDGENPFTMVRLHDVAITSTGSYRVLIARMLSDSATYYLATDGNEYEVCTTGQFVWGGKYPNGVSFATDGTTDIFAIRSWSGNDTVNQYSYDTSTHAIALKKQIYTEAKGTAVPGTTKPLIRQFRPVLDVNGRALLWTRGWYNNSSFDDFNMDLKLYRLDGELSTSDDRMDAIENPNVTVTGSAPTITAVANRRYLCGTLTSLSFTPCADGLCEVIFASGSTQTTLTGLTGVKMPDWWTGVAANRTYDIMILNGVYGVVTSWAN